MADEVVADLVRCALKELISKGYTREQAARIIESILKGRDDNRNG